MRGGPGQRGVAEQRPRGGEGTRRGSVVGRIGRPVQQRLAVVGGVEEPSLAVTEPAERGADEPAGQVDPAGLAGDAGQREQALGDARVVLQQPGAVPRRAVAGRPRQPVTRAQVHAGEQPGGVGGGRDQVSPAEQQTGLGQRGDRQPVPGGDHLVVPAGRNAPVPRGEQRGAHPGEPVTVLGVGAKLQH